MGASSVTGVGQGACLNLTTKELAIVVNNGPQVVLCGRVSTSEDVGDVSSPPVNSAAIVYFPKSLPGTPDDYAVILTPIGGQYAYVASLLQDDDDNFSGFSLATESEYDVFYMVVRQGIRPDIQEAI